MPFLRKIVCLFLTLCMIFATSSTALANTTIEYDSEKAEIKLDDLREVVTYTKSLEAELTQANKSLESERAAVEDILKAQAEERQAAAEYSGTLEQELKVQRAETDRLRSSGKRKNYIIAILAAAVVTIAVTR